MSIIDDSIQLQTSSLNSNIIYNIQSSPFSSYTPLNLFNSSNTNIQYQLSLKQNILTSSNVLLGIGSNLTLLDYNNITLNKPLVFPPEPIAVQTTILNNTPNVSKKYMFTGTCSSSILMPDGFTYYAYDIDLRNYTTLKYAPNPNTPYRIFNIKIFFGSVYFGYLTNGKPNVLSYEVYMSNESQAGGGGIGSAGLNVCAVGYPENPILNTISPTQLSLVCGDFNFVSVLSRVNGTVFNAIIQDLLN